MLARKLAWTISFALVVVLALATGCGRGQSDTAIVRGKVTYRGKPVPNGTINFIPASGTAASGELQPDGSYTLKTYRDGDGAVLGKHSVFIVAMQDMASRLPEERTPLPPPIIPAKYTHPATSGLTAEVEKKENTINFDLQD